VVPVVLRPFHLFGTPVDTGALHSTPHLYDTRVRLLLYGVRPGAGADEVIPQVIATILARALGAGAASRQSSPAGRFIAES